MTILEVKNYRLKTITKLTTEGFADEPLSYGLGIERRCSDGEHWYVIAFIKWNEHDGDTEYETIGQRILDVEPDEWEIFLRLGKTANELIRVAQLDSN